jgi:hypothetical protein
VALALVARERRARLTAVLGAAVAALQNPPLALLVALLGAESAQEAAIVRRPLRLLGTLAAVALALLPALFYSRHFGTWSISVRPAEAAESLSLGRSLDLFFDLNLGLVRAAPLAVVLYVALVARSLAGRRPGRLLLEAALALALAYACTANSNWNNGTTGPSRYTAWIAPLLLVGLVREAAGATGRTRAFLSTALGVALASQVALVLARGRDLGREDHLEHSRAARFVLDHASALYRPTEEVFWERTLHREGWPEGPVVYEREGRCRKALVRRRDLDDLRARCGALPAAAAAAQGSSGQSLDERRAYLYVDF